MRDERVVVRPDRAVVVRQRPVGLVLGRHRAHAPARPERRREQRRARRRRRGRPARSRSRAGAPCSSSGCRRAACGRRARVRRSRRSRSTQNARSKRSRNWPASRSSRSASAVSPEHDARELGTAALGVVDVALHLAGGDRPLGDAAVGEALRVGRVLPRLHDEAVIRAPQELDEAVPVAVAELVDPAQRLAHRRLELAHERVVARPAPGLGEQHEKQRRGVDRAVVAREPDLGSPPAAQLVDDLARLGVDARRRRARPAARSARAGPCAPARGRRSASAGT